MKNTARHLAVTYCSIIETNIYTCPIEVRVEHYCEAREEFNFKQFDVCQYCRTEADHQLHQFHVEYVGFKSFIFPEERCNIDVAPEDYHLTIMKKGKCVRGFVETDPMILARKEYEAEQWREMGRHDIDAQPAWTKSLVNQWEGRPEVNLPLYMRRSNGN